MNANHKGQPRVQGADPGTLSDTDRRTLAKQERKWGEPLANHLIYARVPEILRGAQGMWRGLDASGKIESSLSALLNRRVAILNGCAF